MTEKTYNVAINRLDMPRRFLKLPVDSRGYPVPRFVEWIDGVPDFRCVDGRWLQHAVRFNLCWLCGEPMGRYMAFVIGPMCCINRVSSEPPSHLDCARFACKACPFLTQPKRIRNVHDLPEDGVNPGGIMIERNPGVAALWVTESYEMFEIPNGRLFQVGEPVKIEWYARGRIATREEIMHSIDTGLPLLRDVAKKEGPEAIADLEQKITRGLALVPPPMESRPTLESLGEKQ